jgi:hypothetical protein
VTARRALDPVGALIGNLHHMIGHDATAAFLGQPSGDKARCVLCRYERGEATRDEAAQALAGDPS